MLFDLFFGLAFVEKAFNFICKGLDLRLKGSALSLGSTIVNLLFIGDDFRTLILSGLLTDDLIITGLVAIIRVQVAHVIIISLLFFIQSLLIYSQYVIIFVIYHFGLH